MMIMRQLSLGIALNLILWAFISIATTEGYNVSARHKRSDDGDELDPDILQVKYYHNGQMELVVLKEITDSTLASSILPVRSIGDHGQVSAVNELYADPLHGPIFYHGVNSFSALTYFPRTQTLHGVIDQRYFVEHLPLSHADNPDLAKTFIKPIPDEFNQLNQRICHYDRRQGYRMKRWTNKRKHEENPELIPKKKSKNDDRKKILYPEIFLIVDVPPDRIDVAPENRFEKSIMYALTYWNAVDMLFRTLKSVDVRINIAGILIGQNEDITNALITNVGHVRRHDRHIFLSSEKALDDLGSYIYYNHMIKRDSYDFVIWMTSGTLIDAGVWNEENQEVQNIKKEYTVAAAPGDCGGMHYEELRTHKISNRAIIMYDDKYAQFHVAARGLAQLMFVASDDVEVTHGQHTSHCLSSNPMIQSSGVMDPSNRKVDGYLLWSFCSEIHIEEYSRSQSSCCLFNYPSRSMGVSESPNIITIKSQCECYGMKPYAKRYYARDICNQFLVCQNDQGYKTKVGMPLDGSPCVPTGETYTSFCNHNDCV